MKMPVDKIETVMFAPCGMNCKVCYKHCRAKRHCRGCLNGDAEKPEHCRNCAIRDCVRTRRLAYCYECAAYPCKRLKNLEKSYNKRYGASLTENSRCVSEGGVEAFMEKQKERYTCPACGGIISLHDRECSECRRPAAFGRQGPQAPGPKG